MKRVKEGFTIIELLVYISICTILIGCVFSSSKYISGKIDKYISESCSINIKCFINNCKMYCISKNSEGTIYISTENQYMVFSSYNKQISRFDLPKGYKFNEVLTPGYSNLIAFNKYGETEDACTITFKDMKSSYHSLTICVGTNYVDIKD